MSQNCSLPNIRFIKNARTNRTRDGVITAAQIIKHSLSTSHILQLVLDISKLGPTDARSVLDGVRRDSKNQARCSITCYRPSVYTTIFGPHLLCIGCVRRSICGFQESGCVDSTRWPDVKERNTTQRSSTTR